MLKILSETFQRELSALQSESVQFSGIIETRDVGKLPSE